MRVCCSGNKTEICDRILKVLDKYDGGQTGSHRNFDCNVKGVRLPKTPGTNGETFRKTY